jgi:DnaJ-class molecular chaperone
MNEQKKEQDESMVQCPACSGQGEFRGPETRIKWFECAYCYGTGGVTEARFHAGRIEALDPKLQALEEWHELEAKG